jgi:2-methylisocitrate lyase-like PEP mutase family enzyme
MPIHITITGETGTGRLLGAQMIGHRNTAVAKRIDVYATALHHAMTIDATMRRARLYQAAGADCVYPILLSDEDAIAELVAASGVPVNILADRRTLARLTDLGVARISFGPRLYHDSQAHLAGIIGELVRPGRTPPADRSRGRSEHLLKGNHD